MIRSYYQRMTAFILIAVFLAAAPAGAQEPKDRMQAFLMSFIVPGLGQYYAGSPGYAKVFIASELAIWGGYLYTTSMKDASRDDYYAQAALHAGVNPEGKGVKYLNAIGAHISSFEYNQYQRQASPNPTQYVGARAWEWDREENMLRFRNLRERELDYENYAKFCVAGVVLNHFLAGLNAARLVDKMNAEPTAVTVNVLNDGLGAVYTRRF